MAFGIYVHIPYCIQRCIYCDFATYEKSSILPPSEYIEFLHKEIQVYGPLLKHRIVDTLYFGGGTPSLIEPDLLISILKELRSIGFEFSPHCEITLEINPATLDKEKLEKYLGAGINRFSVGAQSFNDELLERVGRKHNAEDTRTTLQLLAERNLNYTFDLLFALPRQTLKHLERDLEIIGEFRPPHLSAYCLTVPDGHPLAKARLPEQEQIEMFDRIEESLGSIGLIRYEISNFAQGSHESKHNMIYWTDQDYWGIGLSAHSYLKEAPWGIRFWNANPIKKYTETMGALPRVPPTSMVDFRDPDQFEALTERQSLTDYCHTFLRTQRGLDLNELEIKFGSQRRVQLQGIVRDLRERGWLKKEQDRWQLSREGLLLSNRVFEACTFLE